VRVGPVGLVVGVGAQRVDDELDALDPVNVDVDLDGVRRAREGARLIQQDVVAGAGVGPLVVDAELDLAGSVIMLADEIPEVGNRSPATLGGTPVSLVVYVEDADATYKAAIAAGATEIQALEDKFYGDRSGMFKDPWGHEWSVSTHIEDVSAEEMGRRVAEMQPG